MPRDFATCAVVVLMIAISGCSGESAPGPAGDDPAATQPSGPPAESFTHVLAREAEYYTTGPQQGRPPDGKFPQGTKVRVLRRTGGYSLVRTETGTEAYVSSDTIQEPGAQPLP
jgi:hypothetical protein